MNSEVANFLGFSKGFFWDLPTNFFRTNLGFWSVFLR